MAYVHVKSVIKLAIFINSTCRHLAMSAIFFQNADNCHSLF